MQIDFDRETRMYLGLYELELNGHFRALCPPGTVSYDVGGQWGYDALILAKLGRATVVSFEMSGPEVVRMRQTLQLNDDLSHLVRVEHAEIGDAPGQTRLDDYAERTGIVPGFIKVDVEGAEHAVLQGAWRLLAEDHPRLLVEVHSREQEQLCGDVLGGHGYRLQVVNQRTVLPDHRPIPHNRWLVAT